MQPCGRSARLALPWAALTRVAREASWMSLYLKWAELRVGKWGWCELSFGYWESACMTCLVEVTSSKRFWILRMIVRFFFNYDVCCYGCSFKDEFRIIWNDLKVIQFKYKIIDMVISGIQSISLVRKLRRYKCAAKAFVESLGSYLTHILCSTWHWTWLKKKKRWVFIPPFLLLLSLSLSCIHPQTYINYCGQTLF